MNSKQRRIAARKVQHFVAGQEATWSQSRLFDLARGLRGREEGLARNTEGGYVWSPKSLESLRDERRAFEKRVASSPKTAKAVVRILLKSQEKSDRELALWLIAECRRIRGGRENG